ncbi:MAG: DUF4998 domain-containing protein [Chitinophagaceae bacterium]
MPKNNSLVLWIIGLVCLFGCTQKPDDFRDFLNDEEILYPGAILNSFVRPGNERLGIGWSPSPDPSITHYRVYWNNRRDSIDVPASSHSPADTIFTIINNLQEYNYSFFVYSLDAKGNQSVPIEISNARVYGNAYRQSLMNRAINLSDPYDLLNDEGNEITLKFLQADTANTVTFIRYINTADVPTEITLSPTQNSITLNDFKYGTKVAYQSVYKPSNIALDSFVVNLVDTFPVIEFGLTECNKALFNIVNLPNDVQQLEAATPLSKLWDGSVGPQGYPNIFHTNGNTPLPHHFTFDMGKLYDSLRTMEVTGRDCCHNPLEFEVWGIADLTNASTTVPGNDPGWKDDAIAKGWVLLQDVVRTGDGIGPYTINFPTNTPQLRYLRLRIKKVASNESSTSNLSELTIGYKK